MDIKKMEQLEYFCSLKGTTEEKIVSAENALGVTFSEEYRSYLKQYALASMNGHELTGIVGSMRLNVADVTFKNRKINPSIPLILFFLRDLYVIEELHIDDIVVWQNECGQIYQTIGVSKPVKICDSLMEYIEE